MNSNCRVYPSVEKTRNQLSNLHSMSLLSVGILDVSTPERLKTVLDWYTSHMDMDLHVMTVEGRCDVSALRASYPSVTFIVFASAGFNGEKINQFGYGCHSRFFFVTRSDADLVVFDGARIKSLMGDERHPSMVLPLRLNGKGEASPDIRLPLISDDSVDLGADMPVLFPTDSLYPALGLGIYDTALFQRLRGYDEQIHSEFWQSVDWGIRSWTYGYPMLLSDACVFYFPGQLSLVEDMSDEEARRRVSTKALSVRLDADGKPQMVRPKGSYDRAAFEEVKARGRYLVKKDYPTLVKEWGGKG